MKKFNISSIETFGLLDGPGIRIVLFFQGCMMRCKFCHNPETWETSENKTYTTEELVKFILRYKNYLKNDSGITLSGGEPLLQTDNLIELCKELKKHNLHIALDTSGVGNGNIEKLLEYVDLVILSIKGLSDEEYIKTTGMDMKRTNQFIQLCNRMNKNMWIRKVIIPKVNDNYKYIDNFYNFLKTINNVKKVELLPYHNMAIGKYKELNINYPLKKTNNMDKKICENLERYLQNKKEE